MRNESIDGLVVRVRDYGEHDRYLSVLTAEKGRITLLAKGAHSIKGEQAAISQLYSHANFEYYRKGDFNILKGGSLQNSFYALSNDIDRLNLAAYLCDLSCEVTDEGEEAGDILRLMLNALYVIAGDRYPPAIVKGAVEMRIAGLSGYEPELASCAHCGNDDAAHVYLNVMSGALLCPECIKKSGRAAAKQAPNAYDDLREAEVLCPLTPAVLAALRYSLSAPLSRLFSFELSDAEDKHLFAKVCETYLLSHLGRGFETLNFYHAMLAPAAPTHKEPKS